MYLFFSLILSLAIAHDAPLDGLGCHGHTESGTYHCHSGPLSGRTFVDKQSAVNAMLILTREEEPVVPIPARVPATPPPAVENVTYETGEPLKLIAWTAPQLGKNEFEYKKVAHLVSIADIVVFQGVSSTDLGSEGLKMLAAALELALKEKICKAWTNTPGQPRSAVLWKDAKLAYFKDNGVMSESCGNAPYLVRADQVTLYSRVSKRILNVALAPSGVSRWPTLFVGVDGPPNLKAALTPMKKRLKSLEHGFKFGPENLWLRGIGAQDARIVDLIAEYPDIGALDLPKLFSDYCPIYSELRFPVDPDAPIRLPTTSDILN